MQTNNVNEEMTLIAMQIILHAGNAKNSAYEALIQLENGKIAQYNDLIQEAQNEILLAHQEQTNIIQIEASGADLPISLLFIHAQDTLMTSMSELNLIKNLVSLILEKEK